MACATVELLLYVSVRNIVLLIVAMIFLLGSLALQFVQGRLR